MNFKDVELLSAYLDGQLDPSDSTRLNARLASDRELASVLTRLREARGMLRKLPPRRAPRNFTLTQKTAGLAPPEARAYPALRVAGLLASLLFFFTLATNAILPRVALRAAAPYGIGGGGGDNASDQALPQESAPAATELAPALQPFAATVPTATPEARYQNANPPAPQPTQSAELAPSPGTEPNAKAAGPTGEATSPTFRHLTPVPAFWQAVLVLLALLCGALAWTLQWVSRRDFRKRNG